MKTNKPYILSSKEVAKKANVTVSKGISQAEAAKRLQSYGQNSLQANKSINPFKLFINQFKDILVIILLISAVVSYGVSFIGSSSGPVEIVGADLTAKVVHCYDKLGGECAEVATAATDNGKGLYCDGGSCQARYYTEESHGSEGAQEAILIFAIVFAIALIGFFNEYKAEKTVEALRKLVGSKATVRRGGKIIEIDAVQLVPGDVVMLDEGTKVPADIRLSTVRSLYINEASLTGESLPVNKNTLGLRAEKTLGDQKCMAFAGTFVTQGTAEGIVTTTGQNTELGKIAQLVNDVEDEDTPMQRKLNDLGKKLGIFILGVCAIVFVIVLMFVEEKADQEFIQRAVFAFTAAVALAVAAIPEGLAFVVRISLALGARRMAGKNALVRKLSAVEALGSTDVICSDKTGTLTRGEMTVRALYTGAKTYSLTGSGYQKQGELLLSGKPTKMSSNIDKLLHIGAVCNNAHLKEESVLGDPTEGALLVSAAKLGKDDELLRQQWKRVDEAPFTSERKRMSVVLRNPEGGYMVASKGAVEKVLEMCSYIVDGNGRKKRITDADKKAVLAQNKKLAAKALRVLGFASTTLAVKPRGTANIEQELTFVGLQAMMDPPREEVKEVIHRVQTESGIRVVMITGDYIETAKAVAKEIGLKGRAIMGEQIESMSAAEFEDIVEEVSVYARVNPEHKIRIVKALKAKGHQVAMTGDGVNDAPAIKAADIGIAMGITGTDASKEAADLILLDDQFLTIIDAIEEGRGIFDNVRKFVNFLISCNIAEVIAVLVGILVFNNLILTAAQLLFINIVTDGLPAIALGSDPAQGDSLRQKPAHYQEPILNKRTWAEITVFGVLMTIALIAHYWYNITYHTTTAAVSAAFTAMVVYELVRLVDIRTDYNIKWFSNPWLSVAMLSSILLQFAVLYVPAMAKYFDVQPLLAHDWVIMFVGSAALYLTMKALNPVFDRIGPEAKSAKA